MSYDLKVERLIDASPEEVFEAFTDPEAMQRWFALEDGWTVNVEPSELKAGNKTSVTFGAPGNLFREDQLFTEIEPPHRLAYTETMTRLEDGASFDTSLVATFEDRDGKTLLTIVQTGFPNVEMRDGHQNGWPAFLSSLDRFVTAKVKR